MELNPLNKPKRKRTVNKAGMLRLTVLFSYEVQYKTRNSDNRILKILEFSQ